QGADALNVLRRNQEAVAERMKPTPGNRAMNFITDLSSLISLGFSPAYVLTNATQPWTVTLPVLAGLTKGDGNPVGLAKAGQYLKDAYSGAVGFFSKRGFQDFINEARAIANRRGSGATLQDSAKEILQRFAKTDEERAMLESLLERGTLDFSWLNSLEDAMRGGAMAQKWAALQRMAMAFPQQVEAMNRVVTALAAFRLARDENIPVDSMIEFADDVVADT
ncbi:hypothetical protein LPJ82_29310, partial [Klebsiella pneumoniae]|nr:hypothetical protein [Klebsiella pneumoniae]